MQTVQVWKCKGQIPLIMGQMSIQKFKHGPGPCGLTLCVQGITKIRKIWKELASLPFSQIPNNIANVAEVCWGSGKRSGLWISPLELTSSSEGLGRDSLCAVSGPFL